MPNPILIAKNAQTELALLPAGKPAWLHHRRDGDRQDRHPAGAGGIVFRIGTPVFMADVRAT